MPSIRTLFAVVWAFLPLVAGAAPQDDAARAARIDSLYQAFAKDFPAVESVGARALAAELATDHPPMLVDVRPEAERKVSMLPGAISLDAFDPSTPGHAKVVLYCTIGARSGELAEQLRQQGVSVRNFAGSLLAWTHAGGALVDAAGQPTQRVHVYGKRWNLVADGYQAVVTDDEGRPIDL